MKAFPLLALLVLCVGCTDCPPAPDCVDPVRANRRPFCEDILAPVCGCNDVTYDNACQAENAGVRAYTAGPCPANRAK